MNREEFLKQQFITLREEVKETKSRIFRALGLGLVIVPASNFLAKEYSVDTLILSTPLLTIVVALLFMAETRALMRCGRYIRTKIESEIEDFIGWEEWLEIPSNYDRRDVDKYLSYSFYLLFIVYYCGATFLAFRFSTEKYGIVAASLVSSAYVAIGIWFVIFTIQNIKYSVSTGPGPGEAE